MAGAMLVERLVEVAIDAAGAGGARTYSYGVPPALADLQAGEAVLVEYGRRQALGVVIGDVRERPAPGLKVKPVLERVRADGPLLPLLSLELARWISSHYLAPAAFVLRAMLPPGMLERLELVAEVRPDDSDGLPGMARDAASNESGRPLGPADLALLAELADGPRAVRDLAAPEGRAGLLRRLRDLAARRAIDLDWTLTAAAAGPRYERWAAATAGGIAIAATLAQGGRMEGRRLGPRQADLLAELAGEPAGLSGPDLTGRHGTSALASLVRRGYVAVEVRERPRRPLTGRAAGRRGSRPAASTLTPAQVEAVGLVRTAIERRDSTPLLLDGVTGGGKTAVYVEAIAAALELGRPVLLLVPEVALALPIVDRLRADLDARIGLLHSGLGEGERADEWRRVRAGAIDVLVGTRLAVLAPFAELGLVIVDEEHEGTYKSDRTPRLQARDSAIRLAELAGAAVVLGSATPAVDTVGRVRAGTWRRVILPSRPSGAPPVIEVVDLRAELAAGNHGLLSARLGEELAGLDTTAGERAILVINRRGSASVVMCRDCGSVQTCPECERPLVFHQAGMSLRCHHCGSAAPLATRCPACGSPRIRYLGGGTERVEREVRGALPAACESGGSTATWSSARAPPSD